MKQELLYILCLSSVFLGTAQQTNYKLKKLVVDLNANGKIDEINPTDTALQLNIDGKKTTITYELLGFEFLSALQFKNSILLVSGYNSGSGAYNLTYKFRCNKITKRIELIGYDDFNKWVSGSISTSINTITNNWEVVVEEYNEATDSMQSKKHTGKLSLRKVGLTEITTQDIEKLTGIGMNYWH